MIKLFTMATDVVEHQDKYLLTCNVPGIAKENIKIEMDDDILKISVNVPQITHDENTRILMCEREGGHLARRYRIPDVDATKVTAALNDGVLTVTLPKMEHQKPASIQIM